MKRIEITDFMSRWMVACSFLFLVLLGGFITLVAAHTLRHPTEPFDWSETRGPLYGMMILWPPFLLTTILPPPSIVDWEPVKHNNSKLRACK